MGNDTKKDKSDDEGKSLISFISDKINQNKSCLNIFNCGKFGNVELNNMFYNCKDCKDKPEKQKSKKNNSNKNKFGLKYDKKFVNSCWKLYNLSPITSPKECESLKNIVEYKIKKNKILNVVIYKCGDNDDKNDYDIINQLSKIKRRAHPFIIFISNFKSKENYNEYILKTELETKKFFYDILNIYHIKEEDVNEKIYIILWNIYNYFYQIDKINSQLFASEICLNIYLIGKAGAGKSSFINELFGEKRALENSGKNVTDKINEYPYIQKINSINDKIGRINIFDTPGFTANGTVMGDLKTKILNIFSNFLNNKDMIHCFLYFLGGSDKRTLDNDEKELIQFLNEKQKEIFSHTKIFFIINFTNKTDDNDENSYKNMLHDDLNEMFGPLSELAKKENIIEVNLKRDIEKNREYKFGMDVIFQKMYYYFKKHKIDVNAILNIGKNNANRLSQKEILNKQIEKLNESMFFKFFKKLEDYKERIISLCEEKITSSKMATQRIGLLFIWDSDIARCENIRKEMLEFIHEHFKSIFNCDIPFDIRDYKINEEEEFRDSFFIIRWFQRKGACPLVTESKGKEYLEKNKYRTSENYNINSCIYLAELYNNSVDLLLKISEDLKIKYQNEKESIKFLIDLNNAEKESIYEYKNFYNNNILNNSNQNDDVLPSINLINESMISNINYLDKKLNAPKNYKDKENNQFIIELDIKKEHPKFKVIVDLIGNYYVFKIKIDEEEIVLVKSISEIQLEEQKCKGIERGKDKNKLYIKFDLKKDDGQEFVL